jgi:hypothetical protein
MRYENRKFADQTIALDGNQYIGCNFERCNLVYKGNKPTEIGNCSLDDCRFTFDGPAGNALNLLGALYHGGFQSLVESTFNNIRSVPNQISRTIH